MNISTNIAGAYQLLTYGSMLGDSTFFSDVKKIISGYYIKKADDGIRTFCYYKYDNNPIDISIEDAIEKIDELFLDAVSLQVRKNKEYGYTNFAALSAGLDSRMTCYAMRRLGIEDVVTFTYSQSGELDDILPRQMAADLKYMWLFKNLDHGLDMLDIDASVYISDGILRYLWPAQLGTFLELIDRTKLGIVHTGVIGDVVVGSFYRQYEKKKYTYGDGAYSLTLINRVEDTYDIEDIDYELGMMYNRAINGAHMGYATSFRTCCEAMSPFMNLEMFDFCMKLPIDMRINHKLYYKWVLAKYPEATKFSHNGLKIKPSRIYLNVHGRPIPLNGIWDRLVSHARYRLGLSRGMNPIELWYATNEHLKKYMDEYFRDNSYRICDDDLRRDTERLYVNGNVLEKTQCLSLVGILKYIET